MNRGLIKRAISDKIRERTRELAEQMGVNPDIPVYSGKKSWLPSAFHIPDTAITRTLAPKAKPGIQISPSWEKDFLVAHELGHAQQEQSNIGKKLTAARQAAQLAALPAAIGAALLKGKPGRYSALAGLGLGAGVLAHEIDATRRALKTNIDPKEKRNMVLSTATYTLSPLLSGAHYLLKRKYGI